MNAAPGLLNLCATGRKGRSVRRMRMARGTLQLWGFDQAEPFLGFLFHNQIRLEAAETGVLLIRAEWDLYFFAWDHGAEGPGAQEVVPAAASSSTEPRDRLLSITATALDILILDHSRRHRYPESPERQSRDSPTLA